MNLPRRTYCLFLLLSFIGHGLPAQDPKPFEKFPKLPYWGRMYLYWGYNRAIFSKSDIHVHGPLYDFTLYDVTAHDRPTPFSLNNYFNPANVSIPQFNVRLGYQLTERWGLSLGYDHMKYVMDSDQRALISGIVSPQASDIYAGTYLHDTIRVRADFLKFEHTDGLNNVILDLEYSETLMRLWRDRFRVRAVLGAGGIWVVPRSDVRVFGKGLNNDFHVAGYSMSAQAGIRLEFMERLFMQATTRGGWISMPSVLVANGAPELADHSFSFLEWYIAAGAYIRLKRLHLGED